MSHPLSTLDTCPSAIPAEVRERAGLAEGTPLILLDTPTGLVLLTREHLRDRVRAELTDLDLIAELLDKLQRPPKSRVTTVLDASALLAYLQGEDGAELVEEHLAVGDTPDPSDPLTRRAGHFDPSGGVAKNRNHRATTSVQWSCGGPGRSLSLSCW